MTKIIIKKLWENSKCFKKFWKSYFYMLIHPNKCLKLLNFAIKVLKNYNIEYKKENYKK